MQKIKKNCRNNTYIRIEMNVKNKISKKYRLCRLIGQSPNIIDNSNNYYM